jgi:hypothetical protein
MEAARGVKGYCPSRVTGFLSIKRRSEAGRRCEFTEEGTTRGIRGDGNSTTGELLNKHTRVGYPFLLLVLLRRGISLLFGLPHLGNVDRHII